MIPLPADTKIWLVSGITDMHNSFNGLAAKVQTMLKDDPLSGHIFILWKRANIITNGIHTVHRDTVRRENICNVGPVMG